jgi:hypothetical protein
VYLSGALQGGQQTQFVGQTFSASTTGVLTDFQFTLNSSTITSLYGAVYAWDGSKPSTLLWQSPVMSGIGSGKNGGGLFDFSPTGVNVTQGMTYVAVLSTYGIPNNSGFGDRCRLFAFCRLQLQLHPQSRQYGVGQYPCRRTFLDVSDL